jgi:HlyD family secretion protein
MLKMPTPHLEPVLGSRRGRTRGESSRLARLGTPAILAAYALVAAPGPLLAADAAPHAVTALGRIEPGEGAIHVAGPSGAAPVIAELRVEEGDRVEKGQTLAILDTHALREAAVERLGAELENAERELRRAQELHARNTAARSELDAAGVAARVAKASRDAARARLELALVRSPVTGQVLAIHARAGERLGPEGLMELGETDRMYAVAEVYETDVARVRVGQRARIASPALEQRLAGTVEKVGLKVGKMDVLGTDPVAKTDARVVEVRIRLDAGHGVEALTNLQVEVEIDAAGEGVAAAPGAPAP